MLKGNNTARIRKGMVAIISVLLILVTTISFGAPDVYGAKKENVKDAKTTTQTKARKPEVSASSYIVMSGSTSEKVLEHHVERKMQPGRITVLMTAMVVIDNMYNDDELENTVEINEKLAGYGVTFRQGEVVSVADLMTAMLVGGDGQAAEALASYSASSRKVFINEMNSKCMALGIMDTQFDNAGGDYSTDQYSTAADLAVITQAAFRYQKIKDALGLRSAVIKASSKEGTRELEIVTCDPLLSETAGYEHAKGGVMGSLGSPVNSAQFAAVASKDDMQLIVVLMDSNAKTAAAEAAGLFEYADTKATKNTIVKKDKLVGHARVKGGASTRVAGYTATKGFAYVPPEGSEELIQTEVVMEDGLEAPLRKGDKIGEFRIYVADELKGTVDVVTKKDVPEGWPPSKIYISNKASVVMLALLALAAAFIARVRYVKKRKARRREAVRRQRIRELARKQLEIDEDRRRRNWSGQGYADMPPRTSDIRREAINEAPGRENGGRGGS